MSFTTADNVAMFLNKTSLQLNEASIVDMLIGMVDGVIKNYCGWEIIAKSYTSTYDGNGTTELGLDHAPINSVASLTIDGTEHGPDVTINSDDGTLSFSQASGITFNQNTGNIVVTYNAGYIAIPGELAYAASWLVAINFNKITQESIGVVSEQFNTIKVEYAKDDIPIMVKHVLDRYKQIGIF
jgi:hypothetical protein